MRQSKKDQGIKEVLSDLGFAFEFFKAIAHAIMVKGGTMQHMRRVVKEGELQRKIADLIVPPGSTITQPLAGNEYLVPVTYAPLSSYAELEQEFGKGNVSYIFDGRPFTKHASCSNILETPGNKIFFVKHFGREINSDTAIAEMDRLSYRPATHIEAYAFQKVHPYLQREFWIVVLGSFALDDNIQYVVVLGINSGSRFFGRGWFGNGWNAGNRFLFVRK